LNDARSTAQRILTEELAAFQEEMKGWPKVTDCDRLDAAFEELERNGIVARANFTCCSNCGRAEIGGPMQEAAARGLCVRGYAFFHQQSTERAVEGSGVMLKYGPSPYDSSDFSCTHTTPDPCFGADYLQDGNTGQGTKSVTFTPNLPSFGDYAVFLRWNSSTARASNVPVAIRHAHDTATVSVDQRSAGGAWNLLGVYPFRKGSLGSLTVGTSWPDGTLTDNFVIADAAMWKPVVIVDDVDPWGAQISGNWTISNFDKAQMFGSGYLHDRADKSVVSTVRFAPLLPVAGAYRVWARWSASSDRSSAVPVDVAYSGGTAHLSVDQTTNGGAWNVLGDPGGYSFAQGTSGSVTISNAGTAAGTYVIADAVMFEPL
jgi:hypothetical protein